MKSIPVLSALITALLIWAAPARALEATLDVYYWAYSETVPGNDDFVDEYADPVFFAVGLRHWEAQRDSIRLLFTADLGGGPATYAGSGKLDGYWYYKFRGEVYGAYRIGDIAPFVGLGYRWLYDDSGGRITSTGFFSYDRQSQYFYLPVGAIYEFNDQFRIKGQFNYLLHGHQTSYLSDIPGTSDLENDQNTGWGADVTLTYQMTPRLGLYSFFRYWDIDDSQVSVGLVNGVPSFLGLEPHNKTLETGLGISWAF